jgi:hypothetical protein
VPEETFVGRYMTAESAPAYYQITPTEETARQTVSAVVDRWGERALSVQSVASTIERFDLAVEVAGRDDSLPDTATANE